MLTSILASYGDLFWSFFFYAPRFFVFAIIATVLGIMTGWFLWGRQGEVSERIEDENDKIKAETLILKQELVKLEKKA